MTHDEAEKRLFCECPRKILGKLHVCGKYVHCTSPRFPGKVLCFDRETARPADCTPTPAQAALWEWTRQQPVPAAHG